MKTTHCLIVMLLVASPVAFAQVSDNSNAAGGATDRVLPPTQPQADADASAAAQPGYAPNVTAALSPPETMRAIQSTSFDARQSLLNEVSDRIKAGNKLVSSLQADPKAANADVRTEFDSALNDVRVKEKILKRSLKEARGAKNADTWSVAQTTLAADYEAYATAVAELSVIMPK